MMTVALRLTHDEPRLVCLALVYHLGRPGSELDPATKAPVRRGLAEVLASLRPQLAAPFADIELDDWQYARLMSAIHGSVNELRLLHMSYGAPSTVAGFTEAARSLFPEVAADPGEALRLSEAMMMLRRRIERAIAREAASGSQHPGPRADH